MKLIPHIKTFALADRIEANWFLTYKIRSSSDRPRRVMSIVIQLVCGLCRLPFCWYAKVPSNNLGPRKSNKKLHWVYFLFFKYIKKCSQCINVFIIYRVYRIACVDSFSLSSLVYFWTAKLTWLGTWTYLPVNR